MGRLILLLGGNLGDVVETIKKASATLEDKLGPIVSCSAYYRSRSWGFESPQTFINQVLEIDCKIPATEVLPITQQVEHEFGRVRNPKGGYSSRTLDVDILFFSDQIIDLVKLKIPHPRLHQRMFTLLPLSEKWGEWIHPIFRKTVLQLKEECDDDGWVKEMGKDFEH